jgi:hypothetical protein
MIGVVVPSAFNWRSGIGWGMFDTARYMRPEVVGRFALSVMAHADRTGHAIGIMFPADPIKRPVFLAASPAELKMAVRFAPVQEVKSALITETVGLIRLFTFRICH